MTERFLRELYTRQTTQDMEATPTTSQTDGLVGELIWTNNLQQRTTTIVTISFNVFAAILVIVSVLFDARMATKRGSSLQASNKLYFLSKVHAADTFPLIISTAIATQGIVFLGVQGSGLDGLRADNCQAISQVVWPAIWMVAYTLLVFGIEVAFRGFQRKRFHPRGGFTVPICWSVVLTMVIATWVPSRVYKNPKNDCIASLLSWALPWADIALFLNSTLIFLYLLIAFLIVYQLSRTAKMDRMERIAASRTVYYLAIAVILMSGVLPYWARIVLGASTTNAARIATIALNIFGLLTGLLYLVLRSNPNNMAFGPGGTSREQKEEWRFFGSPELDIGKHIINPVGPENNDTTREIVLASKEKSAFEARSVRSRTRTDSTKSYGSRPALVSPPSYRTPSKSAISKPPLSSPPSYRAPPIPNANDPLLISPPTFQIPPQMLRSGSPFLSFNQANYTLFPQRSASTLATETDHGNATRTGPVNAPAPLFANCHRRDISSVTSATVQIGMRLSTGTVIPGVEERAKCAATYSPVTVKFEQDYQKNPRHLPQRSLDRAPKFLAPPIEMKRSRDSSPHEILFRLNSNEELSHEAVHITPPSWRKPLEDLVSPTRRISSWRKFRDRRMKSLPPVPVTPSTMQPPSSYRASFPEPRTPASPAGPIRASQEREALSRALKEDEQWPLQGVDTVLLPDKSYTPDKNRSWI